MKADFRWFDLSETDTVKVVYTGEAELSLNGVRLDEKGYVILPKEKRACLTLEVLSGKCDVEELIME